jgi:hypothetical protein
MLRRPMANWPFVQQVGNKWRGWYLVEGDRRYLPLRATAKEASKEAQDYRDALERGGAVGGMTIGKLADRFLDDVHSTRTFGTWSFYSNQLAGVFRAISRDLLLVMVGPDVRRGAELGDEATGLAALIDEASDNVLVGERWHD